MLGLILQPVRKDWNADQGIDSIGKVKCQGVFLRLYMGSGG